MNNQKTLELLLKLALSVLEQPEPEQPEPQPEPQPQPQRRQRQKKLPKWNPHYGRIPQWLEGLTQQEIDKIKRAYFDEQKFRWLENPKTPGSKAYQEYERYRHETTASGSMSKGMRYNDEIARGYKMGYLTIIED